MTDSSPDTVTLKIDSGRSCGATTFIHGYLEATRLDIIFLCLKPLKE